MRKNDEPCMLTTEDNPYSPFTQGDAWYAYDRAMGYHTPEYLGRIAQPSSALSDAQNDAMFEDAINEIVAMNLLGNYKKVYPSDYEKENTQENAQNLQ